MIEFVPPDCQSGFDVLGDIYEAEHRGTYKIANHLWSDTFSDYNSRGRSNLNDTCCVVTVVPMGAR